jgi:hypothetical protein
MNCYYCELPMKDANMTNEQARNLLRIGKGTPYSKKLLRYMKKTDEHLIRRCDGGRYTPDNITVAHMYCNSTRGDNSVASHKEIMMAKMKGGCHPLAELKFTMTSKPAEGER